MRNFGAADVGGKRPPGDVSTKERGRVLPNLNFVEGDMSEVAIESGAFVVSVHGRSESFSTLTMCMVRPALLLLIPLVQPYTMKAYV